MSNLAVKELLTLSEMHVMTLRELANEGAPPDEHAQAAPPAASPHVESSLQCKDVDSDLLMSMMPKQDFLWCDAKGMQHLAMTILKGPIWHVQNAAQETLTPSVPVKEHVTVLLNLMVGNCGTSTTSVWLVDVKIVRFVALNMRMCKSMVLTGSHQLWWPQYLTLAPSGSFMTYIRRLL
jgi:hypothetical protein